MDKVLKEMRILVIGLELMAIFQPTPLDRVLDQLLDTEFYLDLPHQKNSRTSQHQLTFAPLTRKLLG